GLGEGFRSRHRGIVRRLWLCHDCRTGSTASRGCRRTELHPQLHRLHAGAHPVHQLSKVRGQFQRQLWGCRAGGFKAWRCKARRFEAALRSDLHEGFCLHRAISGHLAAQPLVARHWQTPVDLNPSGGGPLFVHYGSPVITAGNTILVPVTAADGSYQLRAFQGSSGAALYTLTSDYTIPVNDGWTPPFGPALALGTRVYYPGAGGTVYYRDLPNSTTGPNGQTGATGQIAFYGMSGANGYTANQSVFNHSVQISTPLTADRFGNIYFGFTATGTNPAGRVSGIARITAAGKGSWASAVSLTGDSAAPQIAQNSAPALNNNQTAL